MSLHRFRSSSRVAVLLFLLAGLSGAAALQAQPATLVPDINATGHAFVEHSLSYGAPGPPWVEHEGVLLFGARDGVSSGLWRSDGTAEGTFLVRNLGASSLVSELTPLDGVILFSSGASLWRTDGTFAGTAIVGPNLLEPGDLTLFGGSIYFRARTPEVGFELWKTDGTEAGTVLLKDIHPGSDFQGTPNSSTPLELTVSGGSLFFSATHDGMSPNLWKSDGTESGTVRVYSAPPGSFYFPTKLIDNDGTLFFANLTPELGYEPWKSDGTEAGTVLIKDILPGVEGSMPFFETPRPVALAGGLVLFVANDGVSGRELWKSDGTEAGTVLVKDIFPGITGSEPLSLTAMEGRVYFRANDGVHGFELWVTDGTEDGTRLVEDIAPGAGSGGIVNLYAVGSILVFTADDGIHGGELWRSDGTALGTRMLQDLDPGPGTSEPKQFQPAGPNLYFSAKDSVHGRELWGLPKTALLSTFVDVPFDFWAWPFVEAVAGAGLTTGCAPDHFCPGNLVSRAEIAIFLTRGTRGADFVPPPATGTLFEDVPADHWAASWIEQFVADGMTSGCGVAPARYCPGRSLTRAEMAIFLLRAKHGSAYTPPPATGTVFTDVPGSHWAGAWIEQLAAEGITLGCAPNLYCPGDPVNRAQVAAFLARTFSLPLP